MEKYEFEIIQDGMTFRDAIVLPENHGLSAAEIDSMKQTRFDNWYAIVTAPTTDDEVVGTQE
jgi:hypothetical protein